jgi:co-chaperonin GroES (HSP10)
MEKRTNDQITLSNGMSLYVDTKFDEFKHRINEAEILYPPLKVDTGAKAGDTLYFHHHVVVNDGQPLSGHKDSYIVNYSDNTIENQAIAYRPQGTKDVIPLGGWVVLIPIKEEAPKMSEVIEVVKLKDSDIKKGKVAFHADYLGDIGISVGDVVGFNYKFGYPFKIDGETYFRMRLVDLLYVEETPVL